MKNSSRFRETKEQVRARSRSGRDWSAARASTRPLYASHDSSRFRSSSGLTPVRGVDAAVAKRISKRFGGYWWVKNWSTSGERSPSGRPRRRPLGFREKTRPRRGEGRSARAYRLRRGREGLFGVPRRPLVEGAQDSRADPGERVEPLDRRVRAVRNQGSRVPERAKRIRVRGLARPERVGEIAVGRRVRELHRGRDS